VTTFADRKEKTTGRLPLVILGAFAIACLVALVLVGDLARYQDSVMVGESKAALADVTDREQLDQALRKYPSNRILKLVALANEKSAEIEIATRKMLNEVEPATLSTPVDLTAASRNDLEALRRDLKTAESNVTALSARISALTKAKHDELQSSARALGMEKSTIARFMAAVDEQQAEITALFAKVLAARAEHYAGYGQCAALLVREFGSYKVSNGQFVFRLQPTADSYNTASGAMLAATKREAEMEEERGALRRSQLDRWKKFVGS
jgi:hypothetical protein